MVVDLKNITPQQIKDMIRTPLYFPALYLGIYPHPGQIKILKDPTKNKTICCGRRAGKTEMIAFEAIRGAYIGDYKKQMVVAPTYKQSKIVVDKINSLLFKAKKTKIIKAQVKSPYPKITFYNGTDDDSIIDFSSSDNPTSLRGDDYGRIFQDEANFITDDAQAAIRPMVYDTDGDMWKTSTPWTKNHFYLDYMKGLTGKDPRMKSFHFTSFDNPYISRKAIEADIEANGGKSSLYVRTEIYGEFVEDVDMYFKSFVINRAVSNYEAKTCIQDVFNTVRFQKSIFVLGVDIAHQGEDSTVYIILEKRHDKDHWTVDYAEEVPTNTMDEVEDQIRLLHNEYNFQSIYLDYTGLGKGPGDTLKKEHSNIVKPINFTNQSKHDMYSNLNIVLSNGRFKLPIHKKMVFQLTDLRYEKTEGGNIKIHHPRGGHDDFPDALALAALALKDDAIGVFGIS